MPEQRRPPETTVRIEIPHETRRDALTTFLFNHPQIDEYIGGSMAGDTFRVRLRARNENARKPFGSVEGDCERISEALGYRFETADEVGEDHKGLAKGADFVDDAEYVDE